MTRPPRTAGSSHTPYSVACAGGNAENAPLVAVHRLFHAQNTTPKATAMVEATTMSTVRQRTSMPRRRRPVGILIIIFLPVLANREQTHATPAPSRAWRYA